MLRLQNRRYGAKRAGIRRRNPYHTRHAQEHIRACWRKRRFMPRAGKPTVNTRAGQSARARRNAELSHF